VSGIGPFAPHFESLIHPVMRVSFGAAARAVSFPRDALRSRRSGGVSTDFESRAAHLIFI
jgi:hypothetical protein